MRGQDERDQGRLQYRPPQIERIGSVAEITAMNGGGSMHGSPDYGGDGGGGGGGQWGWPGAS